jgi:aspartyl-tRNA(Asn)/glutamyl-tRNA(Gln) amidotransferase subunit A
VQYEGAVEQLDVHGLRARWSRDLGFVEEIHPEVAELSAAAAQSLAGAVGLRIDDDPVHLTDPVRTWLSSGSVTLWLDIDLDMWPSRADDFTLYVRQTLEATEDYTLPRYSKMLRRRFQLEKDCAALFDDIDVLLMPSTAVPAFAAEGPPPGGAMATPFTMLANLCWNPAISVPCGLTSDGLPVGLQIMVRRHADEVALRLARIFEQTQPWPRFAPTNANSTQ